MSLLPYQLELLAPARDTEIAREAILHGADAIYIGGPIFGARHNASNSVQDIAKLVEFAHKYHVRIFATLNTILHDSELEEARKLIHQLYDAGVDALIVQDMGVMELDIPPIEIHASTQCDIRSVEKAQFLARSGFSQLVLPRELSVSQIHEFHAKVDATLEYFIHGALCVAFSGQCNISHAETGRSANRGDCSQACRLPYTLTDQNGGVVAFDKHLLSMKDNNQSGNLEALIDAGVRSFKIEGRYKDMAYVKNITAHYRLLLDEIMETRSEFSRASSGTTRHYFRPDPDRNFHRGATDYFATGRKVDIGAFDSPKFIGLPVGHVTQVGDRWFDVESTETLNNADGLNFMNKREVVGVSVNRAEPMGSVFRIFPKDPIATYPGLKAGLPIHRNRDHAWDMALAKASAERKMGVWLSLEDWIDGDLDGQDGRLPKGLKLTLVDEDGVTVTVCQALNLQVADQAEKALQTAQTQLAQAQASGNAQALAQAERALRNAAWYEQARAFARIVSEQCSCLPAQEKLHICTGGGPGIMEAANRGAHDVGQPSVALNIVLPHEQSANPFVTPELSFKFHYFALRKMHFMMRAKALVAFPGGFGTLDELFEVMTLVQTRKSRPVPILLFGTAFWQRLIDMEVLVQEGTISRDDLKLFRYVDTPEAAWQAICEFYQLKVG